MEVTVINREGWISYTETIKIADTCPVCGKKRGEPYGYNFYEDGDSYWVNRWRNPCGHIDYYPDCIKESRRLKEVVK